MKMHLSISSGLLKPFWVQLFLNIGYSTAYRRYVIVEPICYLAQDSPSTLKCVPIDPLVCGREVNLGNAVASFIDAERNDDIEQALYPYIQREECRYILIGDDPIIFQKGRLRGFQNYLEQHPQTLRKARGLIHYHVDEPRFSEGDVETIALYTKEIKSLGGANQIGVVLSEKDPRDTLEIKKSGERKFVEHLSAKLKMRRIDVVVELFTGKPDSHSPLQMRIDL
jgi:hypothetical protein